MGELDLRSRRQTARAQSDGQAVRRSPTAAAARRCAALLFVVVPGCTVSLDLAELQEGCPEGTKACDSTCVTLDDPAYGCAAESCTPCRVTGGTARCDADGECAIATCKEGFKACDGACVSASNPLYGCARNGCDPCILPDATATCTSTGECGVGSCIGRRGDCNRESYDGCEANHNEDINNCGECEHECLPLPNAEVTCGGANCVVRICDDDWGNCDTSQSNGCETNLLTSNAHCGACRAPCDAGQTCIDGTCQ